MASLERCLCEHAQGNAASKVVQYTKANTQRTAYAHAMLMPSVVTERAARIPGQQDGHSYRAELLQHDGLSQQDSPNA